MGGDTLAEVIVIIGTDESGAQAIDQVVQGSGGPVGIVTHPKHLSGDVADWIVAVTVFTQALPPLLLAIKELLGQERLKELEIDGIKIRNPTPEIVERLLKERLGDEEK
jgi:hypothetical protein